MPPASDRSRSPADWSRLRVLGGFGLILLLPLIQLGWDAQGRNRPALAQEAATRFLRAYLLNDPRGLSAVLVNGAGRFASGLGADPKRTSLPALTVGEPILTEADAEVPFTIEQTRGTLLMVWEGNGWRVRGLVHPEDEEGRGPLIDYSELAVRQKRVAEVKAYAALKPVNAGDFDRSWRENFDVRNEPAGALLRRYLQDAGLSFSPRPGRRRPAFLPAVFATREPGEKWEEKPVTLTLQERSRMAIIDAVAREAGIGLRQSDQAITVSPAQDHPVAGFAGPFRVEVKSLVEDQPHATGSLTLHALAVKLPDPVVIALAGYRMPVPDPEARAEDGRDLFHSDRRYRMPWPEIRVDRRQGRCSIQWQVPLRNLMVDVQKIRSVRGHLSVPLPARLDTGRLVLTGKGGKGRIGPVELSWERHVRPPAGKTAQPSAGTSQPKEGRYRVGLRLSARSRTVCRVCWMAADASGAGWLTGMLGAPGAQQLPLLDGMASLEIKVFTIENVRLPFTLTDIPTKDRPPARLSPVTFPGQAAAVSLDTPVLKGGKVTLQVRNHTNKALEEVRLIVRFLDAQNAEVGKAAVVHPPPVRQAELPGPIVDAGASAEIQLAAAPPASAARVEVELRRALFRDGTTWSPAGR
jgi:hypothetical protein